ncbi:MAG: imidazole glycerol phosphate synthase subunit HisF [Acidobacteria bacterium]|nr:imidazole glycerol phosphate synthase subunit HisF [Acidobacteriota bacterium]
MLKRRLIPKLQMKVREIGGMRQPVLVTTVNFARVIEIGDPVSQAKIYEAQAADELIFLDLDATSQWRCAMVEVVRKAAEEVFMPFTVGGGVRSLADFRTLLSNGADKVALNTAAVLDPTLIRKAADSYGSQCVVLSIDFRREQTGPYLVWTHGGKVKTDWSPAAWALEGQRLGAGEILLTSIDRDGTRRGLDVELVRQVTEAVHIPVVASGGCGLAAHFVEGFQLGKADAVAAGTFFCFKDENPMQTRSQIRNAGLPIRIHR